MEKVGAVYQTAGTDPSIMIVVVEEVEERIETIEMVVSGEVTTTIAREVRGVVVEVDEVVVIITTKMVEVDEEVGIVREVVVGDKIRIGEVVTVIEEDEVVVVTTTKTHTYIHTRTIRILYYHYCES